MSEACVLVVDDEVLNLEIVTEVLGEAGYEIVTAADGALAWNRLQQEPQRFDAVLLDRMMPNMNGMELLGLIKQNPTLKLIPVIMQTAKAAKQDVLDGLNAGAWYYLCKPFDAQTLLAVVKTATDDYRRYREVVKEAVSSARSLKALVKGKFKFRTIEEGRDLASLLSNTVDVGDRLAIGLIELFLNAVEHGNLGIGYADKTALNRTDTWRQEVERRLALPQNAEKVVEVTFERLDHELHFRIRDDGEGFDWRSYLRLDLDRAFDTHGRGIALARNLSFSRLIYEGHGNSVLAVYVP
jgi:CheY-like chemotaxis protein/anti-sigma regulatory factor (Ser/Thr protein kinase)